MDNSDLIDEYCIIYTNVRFMLLSCNLHHFLVSGQQQKNEDYVDKKIYERLILYLTN